MLREVFLRPRFYGWGSQMRTNNALILTIAIALGGIAAFLARNWLLSQTQTAANATTIVVASETLSFGKSLTEENITEIPWGLRNLPDGAFTSKQDLIKSGRRAAITTISRNEPILGSKISDPGRSATLSTTLEKGKRAITVRVDDVRGVAGFIMPNDHVDVVLIRTEGSTQRAAFSDLLLQNVKVIAVDQVATEQKEKPSIAKAITLEATPAEAQKVALATEIGTLSLILRQPGEAEVVRHERVKESDLSPSLSPPENSIQASNSLNQSITSPTGLETPANDGPDLSTVPVYVVRDIRKDGEKYMVNGVGRVVRAAQGLR
jgi:pilus assembly protein CpaB